MYTTYHISYNTLIYSRFESSIHFNPPKSIHQKNVKKHHPKPPLFSGDGKKIYPPPPPRSPLEVGPPGFSSATMLLGSMEMFGARPQRPTLFSSPTTRKYILQKTNQFSVVGSYRGEQPQQKKVLGHKDKNTGEEWICFWTMESLDSLEWFFVIYESDLQGLYIYIYIHKVNIWVHHQKKNGTRIPTNRQTFRIRTSATWRNTQKTCEWKPGISFMRCLSLKLPSLILDLFARWSRWSQWIPGKVQY